MPEICRGHASATVQSMGEVNSSTPSFKTVTGSLPQSSCFHLLPPKVHVFIASAKFLRCLRSLILQIPKFEGLDQPSCLLFSHSLKALPFQHGLAAASLASKAERAPPDELLPGLLACTGALLGIPATIFIPDGFTRRRPMPSGPKAPRSWPPDLDYDGRWRPPRHTPTRRARCSPRTRRGRGMKRSRVDRRGLSNSRRGGR